MKELDGVITSHLEKFKDKKCYHCDSKKNTKSFMAISEKDIDDSNSEIVLKFCCLCSKCFDSEETIAKVINKIFKNIEMNIIEKNRLN